MLKKSILFFTITLLLNTGQAFSEENHDDKFRDAEKSFFQFNNKGIDKSIEIYKKIIEKDSKSARAYAGIAKAYSYKGLLKKEGKIDYENEFNLAFENIQKALKLNASDNDVQRSLAYIYLNLNRSKEALGIANKLIEKDGENFENIFLSWSADGKVPEDVRIKNVLNSNPRFIPAHYELAESYYIRRRNPTQAINHLTKVVEISDSPYYRTYLGRLYRSKRLFTRSIEEFDRALALDPGYAYAKINKGISLHYQAKYKESTEFLLSGLASDADYPEAYYYLGGNYFRTGQKENSIKSYNRFIEEVGADTKFSQFVKQARTNMSKIN